MMMLLLPSSLSVSAGRRRDGADARVVAVDRGVGFGFAFGFGAARGVDEEDDDFALGLAFGAAIGAMNSSKRRCCETFGGIDNESKVGHTGDKRQGATAKKASIKSVGCMPKNDMIQQELHKCQELVRCGQGWCLDTEVWSGVHP
jgi:hypothetical protein